MPYGYGCDRGILAYLKICIPVIKNVSKFNLKQSGADYADFSG